MIKTIIFDIGKVLVDVDFTAFASQYTKDPLLVERILKATVYSGVWEELDRGILSDDEVEDAFVAKDPEIEDLIRKTMRSTKGLVATKKETEPLLRSIKKAGYQLLALSNYPKTIYETDPKPLSFIETIMDGYILSYREKIIKPDPAIYRLLQERYGFCSEECVFIDDRQENVDAATKLGWNGILYTGHEDLLKQLAELGVTI